MIVTNDGGLFHTYGQRRPGKRALRSCFDESLERTITADDELERTLDSSLSLPDIDRVGSH